MNIYMYVYNEVDVTLFVYKTKYYFIQVNKF